MRSHENGIDVVAITQPSALVEKSSAHAWAEKSSHLGTKNIYSKFYLGTFSVTNIVSKACLAFVWTCSGNHSLLTIHPSLWMLVYCKPRLAGWPEWQGPGLSPTDPILPKQQGPMNLAEERLAKLNPLTPCLSAQGQPAATPTVNRCSHNKAAVRQR